MIIGVTGAIGSGKTTVANLLMRDHGFESIAFSDKLKKVCSSVFVPLGAPESAFRGTQAEKNEPILALHHADGSCPTGREIMEHIGTEGFRAIDLDVWTNYVFETIDEAGGDWVIPGLRFPNEAEAIRARSGEVWRVECIGGPNAGTATGHESDEVWRTIEPDRVILAKFGDILGLTELVSVTLGLS